MTSSKRQTDPARAAHFLADILEKPKLSGTDHAQRSEENKHRFSKTRANQLFNEFRDRQMLFANYPLFDAMGFEHQAFVDIILESGAGLVRALEQLSEKSQKVEIEASDLSHLVIERLHEVSGVILIYTTFGDVDLRCKIVGWDLRDVERAALEVRSIPGVYAAKTTVILDETDRTRTFSNMAKMIRGDDHINRVANHISKNHKL